MAVALSAIAAERSGSWGMGETRTDVEAGTTLGDVIPAPAVVEHAEGITFTLTETAAILTSAAAAEVVAVAEYLAALLRPATGYLLPVLAGAPTGTVGAISLVISGPDEASGEAPGEASRETPRDLGDEGYVLDVTSDTVVLRAHTPIGLFRGTQTLRQLLPARLGRKTVQSGSWTIPGGRIVDQPRFAYRGVMLDVARHFFTVADIKRVIELAALHKLNRLHLHLTDDQGWRLAIDSWPRLTTFGGGTEVGTGPGGYYSKDDYREIVDYAQSHFITVVPEVDLPGHTNAALASYAELNCDGQAPQRYTGIDVGFSSLCVDKELTYRFLDDVFGEIAALTPGEYLHIGGDEANTLSADDYATIVSRAQEIVSAHGKAPIGWHEVAGAKLLPATVLQFWGVTTDAPEVIAAALQGNRIVMSPANHTYLDMKYASGSPLGLSWAGLITVEDSYAWDPVTYLPGLDPSAILGVESPLWTETVRTVKDIEFLAFPRLAATAEQGWSPASKHDWADFRGRLAAQGQRWEALDVSFYRSPEIDWASRG
jgi:hexosaminidase